MEKVSTKYNIVPRVIKKQSSMPMLQLINVVLSVVNRAALYNYNGMLLWDPYPWIVKGWTLEIMIKGGRIVVGTPYHQRNPPHAAHFKSNRAEWCPPFINVFYKGK